MTTKDDVIAPANDSGYPLQIAIEHLVSSTQRKHGWSVRYSEHGWTNPHTQESGYLDLVLQDRHRSTFLAVECKRPRHATWLFLKDDGTAKARRHAKAWVTHFDGDRNRLFGWHDVALDPASPEAHYCAMRGQSPNDKAMLERTGGLLVSSTEALATEERDYRPAKLPTIRFYFSVIVTTADLKIATFDPSRISLADGTLDDGADAVDVPMVRFRKQLLTQNAPLTPDDFDRHEDLQYARQSTVFVVRADRFADFLAEFEVPDDAVRQFN